MSVGKSWYVSDDNAKRVEDLAKKLDIPESQIVDGILTGVLPIAEKKAPKERVFNINVDVQF